MSRFPLLARVLLAIGGLVGVVILVESMGLGGWLSSAASTAMFLITPLAVVGAALMGVWSGVKYVRDRGWQD